MLDSELKQEEQKETGSSPCKTKNKRKFISKCELSIQKKKDQIRKELNKSVDDELPSFQIIRSSKNF